MRNRSMALVVLTLFALSLMVSVAHASNPPSAPALIRNVTFEGINASDTLGVYTAFDPYGSGVLSPPTWGTVAAGQSGTHGFWCAGSVPTAWPNYPVGTRGQAALWIPECHASTIKYSYVEPSLGPGDSGNSAPFVVSWSSGGPTDSTAPNGFSEVDPVTAAWTVVTDQRGNGGPPLSAGWLRFQFASNPDQPVTGQGVTLDNIQVTGYEFGPVNSLSAVRESGALATVTVSWAKPKAQGTDNPDSRVMYYRVWRRDVAANTWTELTGSDAITATSFVDSGSADVNKQLQYAVQAYGSTSDRSQWGVLGTSAVIPQAVPHFVSIAGGPQAVSFGGATVLSAALVDEVGAALASQTADVVITRSVGGNEVVLTGATVLEGPGGMYSATVNSGVNASYRFRYKSNTFSGWLGVSAQGYLTTPSTPSKVTHNKTFKVNGSANRAPAATRYVVLKAYHKETKKVGGKNKTVWVYRASAKGAITAGSGTGSYSASFKVKLKGSWRVTASLADSYNPGKTSGPRYFTAK